MLVIYSDEVFGFQSWNDPDKQCFWDYIRSKKVLKKDDEVVDSLASKQFVEFVLLGLDALKSEKVSFTKNILKDDITSIKKNS